MNAWGPPISGPARGPWPKHVAWAEVEPRRLGDLRAGSCRPTRRKPIADDRNLRKRDSDANDGARATLASRYRRLHFHRRDDRRADRRNHRAVGRQKRGGEPTLNRKALGVRRAQEQEDQDRKNGKHSSRVP